MTTDLVEHPIYPFDSDLPYNTGLVVVRSSQLRPHRTTVVTGTPRGGTTMVAECLGLMGLPIGVPIPAPPSMYNYEDPDWHAVLHRTEPGPVDLERVRELAAERNTKLDRWGFKLPMALNSLATLASELRNPAFIMVYRDVVAVASRECIAHATDVATAMRGAFVWQQRMTDFIAESEAPCLLVSYEKALQFPDLAAATLARWAGLNPGPDLLLRAAECIVPNREEYLRGVQGQREEYDIPQPAVWTP